jgi:hypothetical protein
VSDTLTLEMTTNEAVQYAELAQASDKTLSEVYDGFRTMLREAAEHPYRDMLTEQMRDLLTYLEALPEVDCDLLPVEAREVVKGWLIHSAFMLAFVTGYYETMSADA